MTERKVIPIYSPDVAKVPEVQALLERSVEDIVKIDPEGFIKALLDILPTKGLGFLGLEDGELKAVMFVYIPYGDPIPGRFAHQHPRVLHLFSDGTPALRRELFAAGVAVLKALGYNVVLSTNVTGKPDKVWARLMRPYKPQPVGTTYATEF